jgi:hypothetical protein
LVFPLGDLISFAVLITGGFVFRRRAQIHKRLLLLATIGSLMAAPLAHLIGHFPVLRERGAMIIVPSLAVLFFSSAINDKVVRGSIHPVSLWGAFCSSFGATCVQVSSVRAWHGTTSPPGSSSEPAERRATNRTRQFQM